MEERLAPFTCAKFGFYFEMQLADNETKNKQAVLQTCFFTLAVLTIRIEWWFTYG